MIAKKGLPASDQFRISGRSLHPTGDSSFGYVEAKHEQFAWMRGAPQVGFSATIRKIRSRTSWEILLRPTRFLIWEIILQYRRKPVRCQRTTVSGTTTKSDFFQSDQKRRARTQKSLSSTASLGAGFDA